MVAVTGNLNSKCSAYFLPTLLIITTTDRLYPISEEDNMPKALLPVGNKPVISYTLEWLEKAGIHGKYSSFDSKENSEFKVEPC